MSNPEPPPVRPGYRQLLVTYLAPRRGAAAVMSLALLASILFQLAGPPLAGSFVDAVGRGADDATLSRLALGFLAVALLQQGLDVLAEYGSERVAWTATNALRSDLVAHLLALDLGFHRVRSPGELIERVDGDVNVLAGFFSHVAVKLLGSGLLLIGVLIALLRVNLALGLAFVIFTGLTLALLSGVRRVGTPFWQEDRARSAAFYGFLGEVLAATEDLRARGAAPYVLRRFLVQIQEWWPIAQRAGLWSQAVMAAAIVAFAIADGLAYGISGHLDRIGQISLGTVYLVLAYVAMLAAPIETIRVELQDLQRADAAIGRIGALLAVRSLLVDGTAVLPAGPLAVEFRDVSFSYPDERSADHAPVVLDHLSFRLEPGRVLGVIGRTGSGKSTLARLLFRLYDPDAGEVRLGGIDARQARLAGLRARVGLVTQDVQLFAASVRDNLTFFDPGISDARLGALLESLGLGQWIARLPAGLATEISPGSLSAGEAQLVALVRVFLTNPGLVILDEASSRLDPFAEELLAQALDRLIAGRTAIIIAHRPTAIERADEILVLENGRVVEHGARTHRARDPASDVAKPREIEIREASS